MEQKKIDQDLTTLKTCWSDQSIVGFDLFVGIVHNKKDKYMKPFVEKPFISPIILFPKWNTGLHYTLAVTSAPRATPTIKNTRASNQMTTSSKPERERTKRSTPAVHDRFRDTTAKYCSRCNQSMFKDRFELCFS